MKHHFQSLIVVVVLGGLLAAGGCGGGVSAPTSFESFSAADGSFQCEYPADWKVSAGGKGHYWAKFKSGDAEIAVNVDPLNSLLDDFFREGGNPKSLMPAAGLPPPGVATAHRVEKNKVAGGMQADEEQKRPDVIAPSLGNCCKSEFTATGSFSKPLRGYRATVLTVKNRVQVICKCSEEDWEMLKPAFDRVIDSLAPGTPEE